MSIEAWLTFCVTFFVLALNPGPAVLLVVSHGLRTDLRSALLAGVGIATTNAVYFLFTAFGLSALLLASATLFEIIRWGGVAYLLYIGIQMIRSGQQAALQRSAPASTRRAFAQGLVLQAGNPLTIAFFTAFVPQFMDAASNPHLQFLILGASTVFIELIALSSYALVSHRGGQLFSSERAIRIQRRVSGSLLIASALGLALVRQR